MRSRLLPLVFYWRAPQRFAALPSQPLRSRFRLLTLLLAFFAMVPVLVWAQSENRPEASLAQATVASADSTANKPADKVAAPKRNDGSYDPLLDIAPLPKGTVTLIGGLVHSIDPIRNKMTVEPFGGQRIKLRFDDRTHIYRDGVETTQLGIKKGDRVYVDTMLDHSYVFARTIRVQTGSQQVDARGQIMSYLPESGAIVVQDTLTSQPVRFRVDSSTTILRQNEKGTQAALRTGALIAVRFAPDRKNRGVAREVSVLAVPGETFTFAGEVTYLNLSNGILAVRSASDGKSYEIHFKPTLHGREDLKVGAQVSIDAVFSGSGYEARQVSLTSASVER